MRLYLAAPEQIDEFQQQVRDIGERVNDPDLFEHIKEDLRRQRAFLFRSKTEPAMLVAKPVSGPGVLIWVGVSLGRCDLRRYMLEVDLLSRKIGARFVEFLTVRKGFAKKMPALGYHPTPSEWNTVPLTCWRKEYV